MFAVFLTSSAAFPHDLRGTWYNHSETTSVILELNSNDECLLSILHKDISTGIGFECEVLVFEIDSVLIELNDKKYNLNYSAECDCLKSTESELFGSNMQFLRKTDTDVQ